MFYSCSFAREEIFFRSTIHIGQRKEKGRGMGVKSVKIGSSHLTQPKEATSFMGTSITQDMAYRQSLMKYAEKYGISPTSRKYNKSRSYIYPWKARWDGSVESPSLPVLASPQPPQVAHRSGAETNPGHAPPESQPWPD